MKVVITIALLAACAAPQSPPPQAPAPMVCAPDPDGRIAKAEQAASDARVAADAAAKRLEELSAEIDTLKQQVAAAVEAVADAQSDADRAAAHAKLELLQRKRLLARTPEQLAAQKRLEELKKQQEEMRIGGNPCGPSGPPPESRKRKLGKITQECLDNPLAKGC